MRLYWLPIGLFAILASTSVFFFVLHLSTQEPVPLARARAAWRWAMVVALGSFDIWIFSRLVVGIRALF